MKQKPFEHLIPRINLACGKVAEINQDGVTYTCTHCREVIGSSSEPIDCKTKREKAEPLKGDWWMFADEDLNDSDR